MDLRHERSLLGAAHLEQLEQVQTARRAYGFGHLPGLHRRDDFGCEGRKLPGLAPAERTALECRTGIGVGDCELCEVLARAGTLVHALGTRHALGHELGTRRLRDRDQDVRQIEFLRLGRRALALRGALLDFARRDEDPRIDVALAQGGHRHLPAHLLAVGTIVDTLLFERGGQVAELDVVALRDVGERGVEHLVGDLDPEPVGALDLQLLQHQPLEHLLTEHVAGRRLLPLLLYALCNHLCLLVELALQHDAVVDHRGDAIEQAAGAGELLGGHGGRDGQQRARHKQSF